LERRASLEATQNPTRLTTNFEPRSSNWSMGANVIAKAQVQPDTNEMPARTINWLKVCGVPGKYERYSLETYQGNDPLVEVLRNHVHTHDNITLCGKTGCGKTHLAAGMLAEYIKKERNAVFITVPELLLKIRSSFGEKATQSEEELIDHYASPTLLVMDDLGAEKTTEYSITTLFLILDRRLRHGRKTIVTTNLSIEEIEECLGARIASRLSESQVIKISTMADWRKKREREHGGKQELTSPELYLPALPDGGADKGDRGHRARG